MSQYVLESLGGDAQWWIDNTAAVIENKRREGWTDAQITAWLFTPEGKAATGIIGGPEQTTVAAAFTQLAIGKKSASASVTTTATAGSNRLALFGVAAVVLGGYLLLKKGR